MKKDWKSIHIQVPEHEYVKYKVFAALYHMNLQMLVRRSVNYYMQEAKKEREALEENAP